MAPSSRPPLSTGLSLPNSSRREQPSLASATSPVASGSRAPAAAVGSSAGQQQQQGDQQQPRKSRKKKVGRGRMMMVKVFYSLSSPRFGGVASPSAPPVSTPTLQPPSSAFLAVLDPALAGAHSAPSPSPEPERPQQQSYTCLARLSAPVWVQLMGGKPAEGDEEERTEFGKLTLKTCLSAICISRPELVTDPTKDYAVSAVDPYESSLQPSPASAQGGGSGGQGLMEGKGMLSWNLAEKREGTTWVCGRVVVDERERESRRRKRRRIEDGAAAQEDDEDDEDSDDDSVKETLEVWLQLVERPSFTQTQFLTSLRSFANPAQPQDSSDRPSSPPHRRQSFTQPQQAPSSAQPRPSHVAGDPIKRKRPRHSDENRLPVTLPSSAPPSSSANAPVFLPPSAPVASASTAPTALQLQDPRVLALLAQLIPSLRTNSEVANSGAAPLSLDSEQGQALLPAIRTLAEYYGVQLPSTVAASASTEQSAASSSSSQSRATRDTGKGKSKDVTATRKVARPEHYTIIEQSDLANKQNPFDADVGCVNCKRKKSAKWREAYQEDGTHLTACNACGVFYNKNGYHRTQGERATSPNRAASSSLLGPSSTKPAGRPLQGRLTATCEQELIKIKSKKSKNTSPKSTRVPGMLPPLSPSKHVGPSFSRSPGTTSWGASNHRGTVPSHTMTSPGRSPRRGRGAGNLFGLAATSPVRANGGAGMGAGLRSGYESDGEGRGNAFSFGGGAGSIFGGGQQSPSPKKKEPRQMPAYLLTASPGTALDRILNDTNIDLNSFDVEMPDAAESRSSQGGARGTGTRDDGLPLTDTEEEQAGGGLNHALSFYLRSISPANLKENARPSAASSNMALDSKEGTHANLFDALIDPALQNATASMPAPAHRPLNTTDAPTTDLDPFESVLSSLRRDFNTRLSSNALTAPSSPVPSSPCVQPRTSSATPGTKSKAPQSCGRPAPSILDGFINSLVPAFAVEGEAPMSDSDAWTPASPSDVEAGGDRTITLDGTTSTKEAPPAGPGRLLIPNRAVSNPFVPSHLVATSDVPSDAFDYGSLPPSSPPLLPSEAFPTPSEFDSGVTPEEEGYLGSEDATMTTNLHLSGRGNRPSPAVSADEQRAMATLLQSLAAQGGGALEGLLGGGAAGAGNDKIQLDRATVNRLLQMISTTNSAFSPSGTSVTSSKPSPAYLGPPSASGGSNANSPADVLSPALIGADEPFDLLKSFEEARAGGGDLFEAFAGFESM